jgi:hypothetical protein
MKHSDTLQLSANSVQQVPAVTTFDATVPLDNCRWELFAQHVAAGYPKPDAYVAAGYKGLTHEVRRVNSSRLASMPPVQARIRVLRTAAAERATISIAERMAWLDNCTHVDMTDVQRVERCPCQHCWPDDATYAAAVQAYLAALGSSSPLPPPDIEAPRASCRIGPHLRIDTTPTDEWSGATRASFRGARYRPDGSIEVLMEDRQSAADQLNKLQAAYVSRSESVTAHVTLDPSKPNPWSGATLSPEQVLERVRKSRGVVAVIEQQPAAPDATP